MASGIARGRVRTTTTTTASELLKKAAILLMIGGQTHAALVYRVLLCYLTSMLWPIETCQNKVSVDQYHVTISRITFKAHRGHVFIEVLAFDWIVGSYLVNLLKTGLGCSEAG